MANGDELLEQQPDFSAIARTIVAELVDTGAIEKIWKGQEPVLVKAVEILLGTGLALLGTIGAELAKALLAAEEIAGPAYNRLANTALKDITGIDANIPTGAGDRSGRSAAARNIGAAILQALSGISSGGGGTGGAMQPSTRAAEEYMTFVVQMSLEGWLQNLQGEMFTAGLVNSLGDLDDTLSSALGLGRTSQAVMRPFIAASVSTPAEWQINKTYRPTLLSASESVRQFLRGKWTRDKLDEELARQGYSSERIEALVNGQRKFFSASDVRAFVGRNHWPRDRGLQHLRDQGHDEASAQDALRLEGLRRIDQLESSEATAILAAYVDRRISTGEFQSMLRAAVSDAEERALLEELADVRRAVNIKHLSPAEAKAAAKVGILAVRDYERALEQDGYTPQAVDVLGLMLRNELADKRELEELRREQAEERAREKQERETAAAERRQAIEAERALRRRGPISDLERAVVRGLISVDRLREVLAAEYDADTVAIMVGLVETDRQSYLAQLARAEEARQRAGRRDLDVAALERAVMEGLLTPEEFDARLRLLKFDAGDAALLAGVVRERKADQDAAIARRREAEELARRRRIDLGRFERLVRRGARSVADYDALLAGLGFEDADRAAMRELLELTIADDRAAEAERAAAEAELRPRGLSLEQIRRAVILGTATDDQFQRFLVEQNFTADAQALLLADVRSAVTEAADARRRREEAAARSGAREVPLSTLQRAARLGIMSPDAYVSRLVERGYTDDDIAIELELLVSEITEVQAARRAREEAEAAALERGLTLSETRRAVAAGVLTIEDYRAAVIAGGQSSAAADVLVALLVEELEAARP